MSNTQNARSPKSVWLVPALAGLLVLVSGGLMGAVLDGFAPPAGGEFASSPLLKIELSHAVASLSDYIGDEGAAGAARQAYYLDSLAIASYAFLLAGFIFASWVTWRQSSILVALPILVAAIIFDFYENGLIIELVETGEPASLTALGGASWAKWTALFAATSSSVLIAFGQSRALSRLLYGLIAISPLCLVFVWPEPATRAQYMIGALVLSWLLMSIFAWVYLFRGATHSNAQIEKRTTTMTSKNKTVLITGGYGGIGFEAARALAGANRGWRIIIAGRSEQKAHEAAEELNDAFGVGTATGWTLDLASLSLVKQSAMDLRTELEATAAAPISALVLNAATQSVRKEPDYTVDGYESTFAVNHLGHLLLFEELRPLLEENSRVVVTSSGTHDPDTQAGRMNKPFPVDADALAMPGASLSEMSGMQRYATSKLCNLMMVYEAARRWDHSRFTVNAFDPGAVPATGLVRTFPPVLRWFVRSPILKLMGVKTNTPESAGRALAALVYSDQFEGISGKYFELAEEKRSSDDSYDVERAQKLWDDSLNLIKRALGSD